MPVPTERPAGADGATDEAMARLVAAGGRRTASRQAIVEAVVTSGAHVTAEEVAARVQARFPSVNLSTVYRTLEVLERVGVVDHIHFGHGRAVWHLADEAHQHLYCEDCGHVEELPASELGPLLAAIEAAHDFEVDRRHFAIAGRCRACRAET
jgi:Fur family transcriptional regulator, ferric uptake regulator